jgi:FKBP-type peptidyl-prolyl cis-trans isomerase
MTSVIRTSVLLAAIACSMSCTAQAPASGAKPGDAAATKGAPAPSAAMASMSEKQRNSYMIGMDVAKSLEPFKDEIDPATMSQAISAVLTGAPTKITQAEAEQLRAAFGQKLQAKMAAKAAAAGQENLKAGMAFLAENGKKPGVRTTASGLQYQVLRQGSGPLPQKTDKVRVTYSGKLLDGSVFDCSEKNGCQPIEFGLNQVIPGWSEGVSLMPVNSKYRFWIPSNLAYGPGGQGPIGPNATLVFDVELLGIVK